MKNEDEGTASEADALNLIYKHLEDIKEDTK